MRLLHIESNTFHDFFDTDVPPYSILSHRWSSNEATYQTYSAHNPLMLNPNSSLKISNFTTLSRTLYSCEHAWIDTICIDKTSSAELSEAINSMYSWYRSASVCIAYLSDVTSPTDLPQSRWFTRGWTLQELLAPRHVEFYSATWKHLGDRNTLASLIHSTTSIPMDVIQLEDTVDPDPIFEASRIYNIDAKCVAEKMSWASLRETSRVEDMAYCLLGLFNVNMPLLYGEGKRAFRRLQEEILKSSDDESIFAWGLDRPRDEVGIQTFIAAEPRDFVASRSVVQTQTVRNRRPYQITNKGLQMQVHVLDLRVDGWKGPNWGVPINCLQRDEKMTGIRGRGSAVRAHDVLVVPVGWFQSDPVMERYYRSGAPVVVRARFWDEMLKKNSGGRGVVNIGKLPTKEIFFKI